MERRTALLVTVVFAIGMFGGLAIGSIRAKARHIKTEYFLMYHSHFPRVSSCNSWRPLQD
jgi:hypothetical protein